MCVLSQLECARSHDIWMPWSFSRPFSSRAITSYSCYWQRIGTPFESSQCQKDAAQSSYKFSSSRRASSGASPSSSLTKGTKGDVKRSATVPHYCTSGGSGSVIRVRDSVSIRASSWWKGVSESACSVSAERRTGMDRKRRRGLRALREREWAAKRRAVRERNGVPHPSLHGVGSTTSGGPQSRRKPRLC